MSLARVSAPRVRRDRGLGREGRSRVLPRITWGGGVDWTTGAAFAGMGTLGVGEGLTQGGSELGATLLP